MLLPIRSKRINVTLIHFFKDLDWNLDSQLKLKSMFVVSVSSGKVKFPSARNILQINVD